jgi:hypothetical protein
MVMRIVSDSSFYDCSKNLLHKLACPSPFASTVVAAVAAFAIIALVLVVTLHTAAVVLHYRSNRSV